MNDLLYYEPLADLFEGDATYRGSPTQVKFGYLTLAASFHWNLLKLLGDMSPTYRLAPPAGDDRSVLAQLPYLDGALRLHVRGDGVPSGDWLQHATAALLAEIHSDCMASLLHAGSADVASTLLSNVGHTVVIRVILYALRLSHRRTVDLAVLEEALSTLCLLSQLSEVEGAVEAGGAHPLVVKHDGEKVIEIRGCDGGRRAQNQLVLAEGELDRNIRWNHGTMSGHGVGVDRSRADRLAVE